MAFKGGCMMPNNTSNNNPSYNRISRSSCCNHVQVIYDAVKKVASCSTWGERLVFGMGITSWTISNCTSYLHEKVDKDDPSTQAYNYVMIGSAMISIMIQNALPRYVAGTLQNVITNENISILEKNGEFLTHIQTIHNDNDDSVNFSYSVAGSAVQECALNMAFLGAQLPLYSGMIFTSLCKVIASGKVTNYGSIAISSVGAAVMSLAQYCTANAETKMREHELEATRILEKNILMHGSTNIAEQIQNIRSAASEISKHSNKAAVGTAFSYMTQSCFKELAPILFAIVASSMPPGYTIDTLLTSKTFFDMAHVVYLLTRVLQKYNINKKEIDKFTAMSYSYGKEMNSKCDEIINLNNRDQNNDNSPHCIMTYYDESPKLGGAEGLYSVENAEGVI